MSSYKPSLIDLVNSRDEFQVLEDGYTYYWPTAGCGGLSSHQLRQIADEIDRRNTPWDSQVQAYFLEQSRRANATMRDEIGAVLSILDNFQLGYQEISSNIQQCRNRLRKLVSDEGAGGL